MVLTGVVDDVTTDDTGCGWATVAVELRVGDTVATSCTARIAVPTTDDDNPWRRQGDNWRP